jgi:microcystin degradation protein MlrC
MEPLASSLAHAKTLKGGPIVLVDHGDNVSSGGTQDVMATLKEALKAGLSDIAIGPIRDPQTVTELARAGIGARLTVNLGGKTSMPALGLRGRPLELSGTVRRITDGRYKVTCPMKTGLSPGATSSDYSIFKFERVPRPLYPLDAMTGS